MPFGNHVEQCNGFKKTYYEYGGVGEMMYIYIYIVYIYFISIYVRSRCIDTEYRTLNIIITIDEFGKRQTIYLRFFVRTSVYI